MATTPELRARRALLGTALGDAFGERFYGNEQDLQRMIGDRVLPQGPWEFTDDTVMSIAVCQVLMQKGFLHQDWLAQRFVQLHDLDPMRGYGATVRRVLREIAEGADWRVVSAAAFDGQGSMGNGAAMRAAVIGAYFAEELGTLQGAAADSAVVTHSHLEGQAGAIAVAMAAALATQVGEGKAHYEPATFLMQVAAACPDSDTRSRIALAARLPSGSHIAHLRRVLGDGTRMTCPDTVPYALWCVAQHLGDLESTLWQAVSMLGDRDTICAIAGGAGIMACNEPWIPSVWLQALEKPEESKFWRPSKS